jgi:putative transposase
MPRGPRDEKRPADVIGNWRGGTFEVHSLSFVSWQDRKRLLPAFKAIYQAENDTMARCRLDEFDGQWGGKYPSIAAA